MDFIETMENGLHLKAVKEFLPMQPGDVLKTFADVNALSKREAAAGKQTTEAYCKNAPAKLNLAGKMFEVDTVEIIVRKNKMEIPGLFSADTGNMLCSLSQHTHINALPVRVRVLSNCVASDDHMWLICEAA